MSQPRRLRLLFIAPSLDGNELSEAGWAFRWIEALSRRASVTCLASSRKGAVPLAEQLPLARVVTWPELPLLYRRFERVNAMAKPGLPLFHAQARRWIRRALSDGERFDIGHQILPQGMRHATPFLGLGLPYVIGPLGGGLQTPPGFEAEVRQGSHWSTRLRAVDGFRLRHDARLKAGYAGADLVLGVAPYVRDRLRGVGVRRFLALPEQAHGTLPPPRVRQGDKGRLLLLHAGRAVRTKGLRDTIRALSLLRDLPGVRLVSAGDGEDLPACRAEAARLGVADRVTFLGRIPRAEVEEWYARADVFCFPSFREPMGGVLFEAMAQGLPIITAAYGGPEVLIDDSCGIRVPVTTPDAFAEGIAAAIRQLSAEPQLRLRLGQGARARLLSFGSWDERADRMMGLYEDILTRRATAAPERRRA